MTEERPATAGAAIAQVTRRLSAAGIETARLDARLLVAHALDVMPEHLLGHPEAPLNEEARAALEVLVGRRAEREPLAHLTGRREFWSLDFRITPDTLIPRPDSEILVESALKDIPERDKVIRVLDLGTGSGCLLLALINELPAALGTGLDISPGAVAVARANARHLGLAERTSFAVQDWDSAEGPVDVIVANPPYIPDGQIDALEPEVAVHEPRTALAGGADGLALYPVLADVISRCLAPRGRAYVEIGAGQASGASGIFFGAGLHVVEIKDDLSGIPRCLVAAREADG